MRRNRHDIWQRFCDQHRELLAETGLPVSVTSAEHRFRDLLREGHVSIGQVVTSLRDIMEAQWSALERFADLFFHEFESYAPLEEFREFRRELDRRESKFWA